ncbi:MULTISPECIES: tetratricopeptide repeat protein [Bradyrhizobium]|uniref:tetratricopeptide repeat protein n=1 Tax=Bradyrhizobium elkanii TaxID=29448 RepID=UPI0004267C04|nr:tetratricopeptide repeat protein [Bradyrhizobium elkanii]
MLRSQTTARLHGLSLLRNLILAMGIAASGAAVAMDTAPSSDLPDLSAVRAEIYSGEYEKAAAKLLTLAETVHHADVYNLLGFSLRKLKRYDEAARWYKEAIFYDPTHRPALEYQGQLFVDIGDFARAEKNLELLRLLCHPGGCEEYDKLKDALARAGHKSKS